MNQVPKVFTEQDHVQVPEEVREEVLMAILNNVALTNWTCEMAYKDLGLGPNVVVGSDERSAACQEKITERICFWQGQVIQALAKDWMN